MGIDKSGNSGFPEIAINQTNSSQVFSGKESSNPDWWQGISWGMVMAPWDPSPWGKDSDNLNLLVLNGQHLERSGMFGSGYQWYQCGSIDLFAYTQIGVCLKISLRKPHKGNQSPVNLHKPWAPTKNVRDCESPCLSSCWVSWSWHFMHARTAINFADLTIG